LSAPLSGFAVWNRGKRSITLDLKQGAAQKVVRELAGQSDVLVQSFRPGVAERLGVDYETLSKDNPRLVYCAISGYGESGPYRDKAGWDPLVSSYAAIYSDQPGEGEPPTFFVLPLASYYGAFMAAFSTVCALHVREITGRGQKVEMPLLNALALVQTASLLRFEGQMRLWAWPPRGPMPLYRLYQASDGLWFFLGLGNYTFFTKFALAMGHDEWLTDPLFEGAPMLILPPRADEVERIMDEIIAGKTRQEWLEFLEANDIPCAPARRVDEFLDDPQVAANEMIVELEDPNVGPVRQMGVPVKLSQTPPQVKGPSPLTGEHTDEVLSELGYPPERVRDLREKGIV
jgi:crotonobetainyl-CoA:carnitine CoA-transferase CaiB-like acyl-CoA transferase